MSQEYVQLVLGLQPAPDVDLVQLVRDDSAWSAWAEAIAPTFHGDCEIVSLGGPEGELTEIGVAGLRTFLRDWLMPWAAYWSEAEAVALGERVLLVSRDHGSLPGTAQEVKLTSGEVWSVGDGKIIRVEFYVDLADAHRAVGLGR